VLLSGNVQSEYVAAGEKISSYDIIGIFTL